MSMLKGGKQMINGGGTEVFHSNIVFNTAHRSTHCRFPDTSERETAAHETNLVRRNRFENVWKALVAKTQPHYFLSSFSPNFIRRSLGVFGGTEKEEKKAKLWHIRISTWVFPIRKGFLCMQGDWCLNKFYLVMTVCNARPKWVYLTLWK